MLKQVKFTGFLKSLDEFLGIKTKLGEIIPAFIGQGLFTTLDQLVDDISAATIAERRLIDATKDTATAPSGDPRHDPAVPRLDHADGRVPGEGPEGLEAGFAAAVT